MSPGKSTCVVAMPFTTIPLDTAYAPGKESTVARRAAIIDICAPSAPNAGTYEIWLGEVLPLLISLDSNHLGSAALLGDLGQANASGE